MASATVTQSNTYKTKLQKLDLGVRQGMLRAGAFLVNRVQLVFRLNSPKGYASGALIRGIGVSPVVFSSGVYRCRIGSNKAYGWYVHQGTGPAAGRGPRKPPPTEAIYLWVKEKGIVPTTYAVRMRSKTGRFLKGYNYKRRSKMDIEKQRRQLAFLIARKIGKEGTKPFPFLTTAYIVAKSYMEEIIVSSIVQSLR